MMIPVRQRSVIVLICLLIFPVRFAFAEPETDAARERKPFAILFKRSKITFSGSIDAKETADSLAGTILDVRPDMNVVDAGMDFNDDVKLPDRKLLESLIVEIALSTDEGVFEISDDVLVVGGLTDSVVAESVIRLRARALLGKRRYQEQICLVPVEDLPDAPVLLSSGETRKAFTFEQKLEQKKQEASYETPGIMLTKIRSLIEGTADPSIYPEITVQDPMLMSAVVEIPEPLVVPAEIASQGMKEDTESEEIPPESGALSPYEEFGPILFARNSFVLQTGQREMIEELVPVLKAEPWVGHPIIVRSLIYSSGADAFSSWISEKRLAEAVRLLSIAGIHPNFLKAETAKTLDRIDKGEVKILITKPPGYVSPTDGEEEEEKPEP